MAKIRKITDQNNLLAESKNNISYEGKVSLSIRAGDKVIKKLNYKNNGGAKLFEFLAKCLAGSYSEAEQARPFKIMLFNNKEETYTPTVAPTRGQPDEEPGSGFSKGERCSVWAGISEPPKASQIDSSTSWGTKFSFMVPFSFINDRAIINQISLYPIAASESNLSEYSAYFYLVKSDKSGWEPIDSSNYSKTYNLYIEWELILSNKTA